MRRTISAALIVTMFALGAVADETETFVSGSDANVLQKRCETLAIDVVRKNVELYASEFELEKIEKGPSADSFRVVFSYLKSGNASKCYNADAFVSIRKDAKKQTCEVLGKPRVRLGGDCRQEP